MHRTTTIDRRTTGTFTCGTKQWGTYYRKYQSGDDSILTRTENPYTCEILDYHNPAVNYLKANGTFWLSCTALDAGHFINPSNWRNMYAPMNGDAMSRVTAKNLSKLGASGFNTGIFVAESRSSLQMITKTASDLVKAYSMFRKGRVGDAWDALMSNPVTRVKHRQPFIADTTRANSLDSLSNAWLQFSYGWKPLVNDMGNLGQALADRPPLVRTQRYRSRDTRTTSANAISSWHTGVGVGSLSQILLVDAFEDPSLMPPTNRWDFLSIAWEVTPFSFVADWGLGFGSYLENRRLAERVRGRVINTTFQRLQSVWKPWTPPYYVEGSPKGYFNSLYVNRTVGPIVVPYSAPRRVLTGETGWRRALSALSLLNQKLR